LTFQYHPSETFSIEYVLSRGCMYTESVFRMMCDLSQEIPAVSLPGGIDFRRWHMESEQEQQAYVQARNEAFPEAPVAFADWQYFLSSPAWQEGTTITAFDGQEIVGSVAVYWDETIRQMTGKKAGVTEYIFVRESWRRRGIAAYLIHQGLGYLKEHGREAACLEVRATNQHALDLYHRLGYRTIDETRFYVLEL
jgi:ribosomal protein S18 acetylase RimI-like enzyme